MNKVKLGPKQLLGPAPAILVGTYYNSKPNFITVGRASITSAKPLTVSIAVRNTRYSLKGFKQNMTFSVNIPSVEMFKKTDYCGIVSGSKYDKVKECNFDIFYGNLKTAPLIKQCPINIECEIIHIIALGSHSLIIGEIIESYITADCLTNNIPDINKIDPLCFCSFTPKLLGYYSVGNLIAKVGVGKEIKK
ncbi:MAG: flavin reductase family protein [bacterium]|nr:flavin reductase family protein [bacterium]